MSALHKPTGRIFVETASLQSPATVAWPAWPLKLFFAVLFFGPIVAPLFQATQLWLIADSGALARDLLSRYVCPTPAKSYVLLGYPMAVCARCWGATIGLWLGWWAFKAVRDNRRFTQASPWTSVVGRLIAFPWPLRLTVVALPFLLWVAEIMYWPTAPLAMLLVNGAQAGFWAGLFFCSLWPGLYTTRKH